MRRTPEATDPSDLMRKGPALAVLSRWVPPQNVHGEIAHFHHAHHVAVLLAEHGHRALALGLLNGQDLRHHGQSLQNGVVHQPVNLAELVRGDGLEVGEVKADAVRLHQGARLMHVVAQNLFQPPSSSR